MPPKKPSNDLFEWTEVITKKKPETIKWHSQGGWEVNVVKISRDHFEKARMEYEFFHYVQQTKKVGQPQDVILTAAEVVESWQHQIILLYGPNKLYL
jgi:hypothetical protein